MDNIVIDGINHYNYTEKEPDMKKGVLDNFKLYYKIFPEDYSRIKKNSIIAYQLRNKTYNYGFLIKHIEPNIFILKDPLLYYIWSIIIEEGTDIYIKNINLYRKENKIKELLFEEYKKSLEN